MRLRNRSIPLHTNPLRQSRQKHPPSPCIKKPVKQSAPTGVSKCFAPKVILEIGPKPKKFCFANIQRKSLEIDMLRQIRSSLVTGTLEMASTVHRHLFVRRSASPGEHEGSDLPSASSKRARDEPGMRVPGITRLVPHFFHGDRFRVEPGTLPRLAGVESWLPKRCWGSPPSSRCQLPLPGGISCHIRRPTSPTPTICRPLRSSNGPSRTWKWRIPVSRHYRVGHSPWNPAK